MINKEKPKEDQIKICKNEVVFTTEINLEK